VSSKAPANGPAPDTGPAEALLAQCWQVLADVYLPRVDAIFQEALSLAMRSGDEAQARAAAALALHEKALVRAYAVELRGGFDGAVAIFLGHRLAPVKAASALSLMEMGESELRSQIDQVAARLRNQVGSAHGALSQRLQALRPGGDTADGVSPLRPAIFLDAVADAVEIAAPDVEGVGGVLRHFVVPMAPALEAAYEAVGRYLEGKGIAAVAVSRMRPAARAAPSSAPPAAGQGDGATAPAAPAPPQGAAAAAEEPLRPARAPVPPAMPRAVPAPAPREADPESSVEERALADYARLQASLGINAGPLVDAALEAARRSPGAPPAAGLAPAPALAAAMLSAQRQDAARVASKADIADPAAEASAAEPGAPAKPAGAPEFVGSREYSKRLITLGGNPLQRLTLQIVARIFARIERDRMVPPPVRTLLVCLRFPFLETALVDPAVLVRADHPARRLINAIATSSIGWNPEGADNQRYLRHARSTVHFVVHSPGSAPSAFVQSCDQFEAFLAAVVPATGPALVTARNALREAEKRAFQAAEAAAFLGPILEGAGLEAWLRDFILGPWVRVLAEGAAAEAREPGRFRRLLMVIPDLIASVQPPGAGFDRKRMVETIAGLLAHLREGAGLIAWPSERMDAFLERLMKAHAQVLSGSEPAPGAAPAFSASTVRIRLDGFTLRDTPEPGAEQRVPVLEEAVQNQLARSQSTAVHQWYRKPLPIPAGAIDIDAARQQVGQWRDRMWFDIRIGRTLVRMRLVAWTPGRTLVLFSSRSGGSLASISHDSLVAYLRCGLIKPAEPAPLLTRALRSVLKDLRRTAQAAAAANANGG